MLGPLCFSFRIVSRWFRGRSFNWPSSKLAAAARNRQIRRELFCCFEFVKPVKAEGFLKTLLESSEATRSD